jgi:hypothetical protein
VLVSYWLGCWRWSVGQGRRRYALLLGAGIARAWTTVRVCPRVTRGAVRTMAGQGLLALVDALSAEAAASSSIPAGTTHVHAGSTWCLALRNRSGVIPVLCRIRPSLEFSYRHRTSTVFSARTVSVGRSVVVRVCW